MSNAVDDFLSDVAFLKEAAGGPLYLPSEVAEKLRSTARGRALIAESTGDISKFDPNYINRKFGPQVPKAEVAHQIDALGNAGAKFLKKPEVEKALTRWGKIKHHGGRALLVAGATAGIAAGAALISSLKSEFDKKRGYENMLKYEPSLKKDDSKARVLYNSLHNLAPGAAKDPLVAASFVRKTIELSGDKPYIAVDTAKQLADTHAKMRGTSPFVDYFSKGLGATALSA